MARPQKENGYTSIANELLEAIMRVPLPLYEWRVLLCIIRFTYGWNRKEAHVSYTTISRFTGIKAPHVVRAVKGLSARNMIRTRKGREGIIYAVQKDYDKWLFPPEGIPAQAKSIASTGNTPLPPEGMAAPSKPLTGKGQPGPKERIKDIKDISLRERLLKETKKIFPALSSIPDSIPDERLDFIIYKVGKGEIRADAIKNPLAYLKALTVCEAFPPFLEREARREKRRREERERRKREEDEDRKAIESRDYNAEKAREVIKKLSGGRSCRTFTPSDTSIRVI